MNRPSRATPVSSLRWLTRKEACSVYMPVLVAGTLLFGLGCPATNAAPMALAPGDPAPKIIRGYDLEAEFTTTNYGKKATLVLFWTTWSEPSLELLPALQKVYAARAREGLRIMGLVTNYTTVADIQARTEQANVKFTVLKPHSSTMKAWRGISSFPTSFLVDGNRVILRRYSGATAEQIEGMIYDINAVMDGKPLGPFVLPERSNARSYSEYRQEQRGER